MKQIFTSNDLVKFIYKETSASETAAIREALLIDSVLMDHYQMLMTGYTELPRVTFAPSGSSLKNILNYSTRAAVEA